MTYLSAKTFSIPLPLEERTKLTDLPNAKLDAPVNGWPKTYVDNLRLVLTQIQSSDCHLLCRGECIATFELRHKSIALSGMITCLSIVFLGFHWSRTTFSQLKNTRHKRGMDRIRVDYFHHTSTKQQLF